MIFGIIKRVSNYLKMRVFGALEYAEGESNLARYQAVSAMTFTDENGKPLRFTWRTIQTWWHYYRRYGITEAPVRSDKGTARKVVPEHLLKAIEQVRPSFTGKNTISRKFTAPVFKGTAPAQARRTKHFPPPPHPS